MPATVRIVCVSDTHNARPGEGFVLPKGGSLYFKQSHLKPALTTTDILIHAGDLTNQGTLKELEKALVWITKADFGVKIVVAGNHDISLDPDYNATKHDAGWHVEPADAEACRQLIAKQDEIVYLQHSSKVVHLHDKDVTLRVFGSPYSIDRGKQNWAYQYPESRAFEIWTSVPLDTDILITHTPPSGYCDASTHWIDGGCLVLKEVIRQVRPFLHVCGHCHEGRGALVLDWSEASDEHHSNVWSDPGSGNQKMSLLKLSATQPRRNTAVVNASIMARSHGRGAKRFNRPIVVDLLLPTTTEQRKILNDQHKESAMVANKSVSG